MSIPPCVQWKPDVPGRRPHLVLSLELRQGLIHRHIIAQMCQFMPPEDTFMCRRSFHVLQDASSQYSRRHTFIPLPNTITKYTEF